MPLAPKTVATAKLGWRTSKITSLLLRYCARKVPLFQYERFKRVKNFFDKLKKLKILLLKQNWIDMLIDKVTFSLYMFKNSSVRMHVDEVIYGIQSQIILSLVRQSSKQWRGSYFYYPIKNESEHSRKLRKLSRQHSAMLLSNNDKNRGRSQLSETRFDHQLVLVLRSVNFNRAVFTWMSKVLCICFGFA